jgi:DNA invertase Pin-like site-specific DNA recombinase
MVGDKEVAYKESMTLLRKGDNAMATKHYKRDFMALEQRRKRAAHLLSNGVKQADIARELAVSRQSVSVWAKELDVDQQAWRRKPLGSQPGLGQAQRRWLGILLQ